ADNPFILGLPTGSSPKEMAPIKFIQRRRFIFLMIKDTATEAMYPNHSIQLGVIIWLKKEQKINS
ncbi:MAG: hypothetical protein HOG73_09185, partial [Candidatus Marinimicrobia bacterium]|nr:hypothetical protein [Candidatus Neomarinimicrobiota bacterium]